MPQETTPETISPPVVKKPTESHLSTKIEDTPQTLSQSITSTESVQKSPPDKVDGSTLLNIEEPQQNPEITKPELSITMPTDTDIKQESTTIESNQKKLETPKIEISPAFDQIGGHKKAKTQLTHIAAPFKNLEKSLELGIKTNNVIVLTGPPDNGKNLLAEAFAKDITAEFVKINPSSILSKKSGEAEEDIKRIFREAQESDKKTILFFPDIESLAPDPAKLPQEYSCTLTNTLINEIYNIKSDKIIVIGSTNDQGDLNYGLKSVINCKISTSLPNREEKEEILNICLQNLTKNAGKELFEKDLNIKDLVASLEKKHHVSAKTIHDIINKAQTAKFALALQTGEEQPLTTKEDIMKQIQLLSDIAIENKEESPHVNMFA